MLGLGMRNARSRRVVISRDDLTARVSLHDMVNVEAVANHRVCPERVDSAYVICLNRVYCGLRAPTQKPCGTCITNYPDGGSTERNPRIGILALNRIQTCISRRECRTADRRAEGSAGKRGVGIGY